TLFTQTDFLTLDFTSVTSDVTGFTQRAARGFVVLDQSASDAMTDGTGLTTDTATGNGNEDVELLDGLGQLQRLTHDHASGLAAEEGIQAAIVDRDVTSTRTQEYACGSGLATASAVILSRRHNELFR